MVSKDEEVEKAVSGLLDTYKVVYVVPGHCTGEPTFAALRKAFGARYLYAGLGTTLALGAMPRPVAGAGPAVATGMDEDDLNTYRVLLENSDDDERTVVAQDAHGDARSTPELSGHYTDNGRHAPK